MLNHHFPMVAFGRQLLKRESVETANRRYAKSHRWPRGTRRTRWDIFVDTLWWTNSSQWKMAIEIVDFPINSMVIFHSKMLVHQRVPILPEHILQVAWFLLRKLKVRISARRTMKSEKNFDRPNAECLVQKSRSQSYSAADLWSS